MSLVEQLLLALRFNTSISDYLLPISFLDKFLKRGGATFTPSTVLPTILEVLAQEGYCPQRDGQVRIIYKNKGNPCYFFDRTLREVTEAQKAEKGDADTSTTLIPPSGSLPS